MPLVKEIEMEVKIKKRDVNDSKFFTYHKFRPAKTKTNYYNNNNVITAIHNSDICGIMDKDVYDKCPSWMFTFYNILHHSNVNPFFKTSQQIKAHAMCDDRDEYNEDIGKRVATIKCELKTEYRISREFKALSKIFIKLGLALAKLSEDHAHKAESIQKKLNKYYNEGE